MDSYSFLKFEHRDLNQELLKEEEGLVGHRGLITTYTGDNAERLNSNQLFNIFITNAMRESFEAKVLRHVAQVSKCKSPNLPDLVPSGLLYCCSCRLLRLRKCVEEISQLSSRALGKCQTAI
jgi:hypothetical protein